MDIVFRTPLAGSSADAQPGELSLRPTDRAAADTRQLSLYVLDHGVESLVQGPGPIERIVVQHDPTLDDMLAALIAERQLAGQPLKEGIRRFALYAALAREGLNPGNIPPEQSLAGLFQVVRSEAGADLTQPSSGGMLRERWRSMARRIVEAVEKGLDPAKTPIFEESEEFARQRIYLREDKRVYLQQDVPRGDRWKVSLPGGPPQADAVVLRQPKSRLFKFWSRAEGNLLSVVEHEPGEWVITTDPVQQLSLKTLADVLQQAELKKHASAKDDPWFDGARFRHTLVAAPRRRTQLSADEVLRVVRQWAKARALHAPEPWHRRFKPAAPLATAVLAAVLGIGLWNTLPGTDGPTEVVRGTGGDEGSGGATRGVRAGVLLSDPVVRALEETTMLEADGWTEVRFPRVENHLAVLRMVRLTASVASTDGTKLEVDQVRVRVNSADKGVVDLAATSTPQRRQSDGCQAEFDGGQNEVVLLIHNPGPATECRIALQWEAEAAFRGTLHVVSIGVSDYEHEGLDLDYADDDANGVYSFFESSPSSLFQRVVAHRLVDKQAHADAILDLLAEIAPTAHDLVLITISGHGDRDDQGNYFFLPYNYNPDSRRTRIYWDDFKREMERYPCLIVMVLDTCHAGAVTTELGGWQGKSRDVADLQKRLSEATEQAVESFQQSSKGLVVLTATLSNLLAEEVKSDGEEGKPIGHGALTLAVLEALQNRRLFDAGENAPLPRERNPEKLVITLQDVIDYAVQRVPQLVTRPQAVVPNQTGDIALESIPLATVKLD